MDELRNKLCGTAHAIPDILTKKRNMEQSLELFRLLSDPVRRVVFGEYT